MVVKWLYVCYPKAIRSISTRYPVAISSLPHSSGYVNEQTMKVAPGSVSFLNYKINVIPSLLTYL